MNNQFLKFKLINNSKNPSSDWAKKNRGKSYKVYPESTKKNLGIPTGKINNILVVDLDSHKWDKEHIFYKLFNFDDLIKLTYTVKTVSGGYHLYFTYDEEIRQTQNSEYNIDIRSDGGYIVSAGSSIDGKYYTVINNKPIINIPDKLKLFILENLYTQRAKKQNKKVAAPKGRKKIKNTSYSILKNILTDDKIKNIINSLDSKYWNGYNNFLLFTSFMKTLDKFDLWDEINKTKNNYNYNNNIKIWNGAKIGDGFIYNILDEDTLNFNFYKSLPKNKIKANKIINSKKLGYKFLDNKNNYIIKSDTGTGKTTSFKYYVKNNNKKFISIVSRISLAEEQYNNFSNHGLNCKLYNIEDNFYNGDNVVITIDSILKLRNINFNNYVIFLDEFASLIEYLICSSTLKSKRTSIFNMFIKLINKSKQIICADADINDISIKFLNITNKKFTYIKNKFKHNKGINAHELFNIESFIDDIKTQNKYLICCDSKRNAELIYSLLKDNNIKIITSDNDEYINFDEHDKIIYSPKIIYGIDSTIKRNVYCFYKEHTISPRAMVQQVARCRNIKKLKFLFLKKTLKYDIRTKEDIKNEIIEQDKYGIYEFELNCSELINDKYIDLLTEYEYLNSCYNTNKYVHFIKILKNRGFNIKTQKQTTEKNISSLLKELKQLKEDNFNIDNPIVKKVNDILKIPVEDIETYKEYFLNPNLLDNHFNYCKFINKDIETLKDSIINKEEFNSKKTISTNNKILYLKKLIDILNIDNDYINIFDNEYNLTNEQKEKLYNEYNIVYVNRNTKKDFSTNDNIKYYICKMFKNLFNSKIIISKRDTKTKKYNYSFNKDFINTNNNLYQYRKPIDNNIYLF